MLTLDEAVTDLAHHYGGPREPSLLDRLANPEVRTSQPRDGDPVRSTPHSRPPADLSPASWLLSIQREAIVLDMRVRSSTLLRPWRRAVLDLPVVTPDDQLREVRSRVGMWHSTCLTVLGFQAPATPMRHITCLVCDQRSIVGRADSGDARAWCTNPDCEDRDTGKPARYTGTRMLLLTQKTA